MRSPLIPVRLARIALVLSALCLVGLSRADVIYDTHDIYVTHANNVAFWEGDPNGDDGTPGRPAGDQMGNSILFGGTARHLTSVSMYWSTFFSQSAQDITLSLYLPNGSPDLTGPGTNGLQPGTLLAQSTVHLGAVTTNSSLYYLTYTFDTVVPDAIVAIAKSSSITAGPSGPYTGIVASTDFTPLVGSNPHGDRMWYGSGSGTFQSNTTWVTADAAGPGYSNNAAMVFTAVSDSAAVPEPGAVSALAGLSISAGAFALRRRARKNSLRDQ